MAHKMLLTLGLVMALSPLAVAQDKPPEPTALNLSQAREALDEIKENRDHVDGLLAAARQGDEQDLQTCIAPRASQLTTLSEVSEGILSDLTSALGEGEDGRAAAEGRKLSIAASRARGLRAEADGCVDGGQSATGEVIVDDPYANEANEDIDAGNDGVGDDPPGASPFE